MTVVVYTAWFGAADTLQPPAIVSPDVRYLCLTDRLEAIPGWEIQRLPPRAAPRAAARYAKTHPEACCPPADVTIWMDASFALLMDVQALVRDALARHAPIVGFAHPDRTRMTDEAEAVRRAGLAPAAAVQRQVETYHAAGFDTDASPQSALTTTGLLIRSATSSAVAAFNARWWQELQAHTLRDQLSVDFVAARTGTVIGYLDGHYRANRYVRYDRLAHRRERVAS